VATAEKLTAELDFIKECLQQRKPNTATHSANIKVINETVTNKPPSPKPLPKKPDVCPIDCPGALEAAACKYTCMKKTSAKTGTGPPDPIGHGRQ